MAMFPLFYLSLLAVFLKASGEQSQPCDRKTLMRYNVTFYGLWTREDFPKQYPLFRPHAQWSTIIGRSHDQQYDIFKMGKAASEALKRFVEKADAKLFSKATQGRHGVLDVCDLPAIDHAAVGTTSAHIFVDGIHSRVSLVAKVVPSPDWFVGVDSVDLCVGGHWKKRLSIDLHPMDAGTDQGYTFTAPNWAEDPQLPISAITSQHPNHPANSFYYPDRKKNPPLARVTFERVTSYSYVDGDIAVSEAKEVSDDAAGEEESDSDKVVIQSESEVSLEEALDDLDALKPLKNSKLGLSAEAVNTKPAREQESKTSGESTSSKSGSQEGDTDGSSEPGMSGPRPKPNSRRRKPKPKGKQEGNKGFRLFENAQINRPIDCKVGEWSDWGECSKTCGFGSRSRSREMLTKPKNYGRPCPLLIEDELCGSMRNCRWNHFNNLRSRFRFGQPARKPQTQRWRMGTRT